MSLDRPETIVASKRVTKWSLEDQEWLSQLPLAERVVVQLLVAHLDATVVTEKADD